MPNTTLSNLIPKPVVVEAREGEYRLSPSAGIILEPASEALAAVGSFLEEKLSLGSADAQNQGGKVILTTLGADPDLGDEGYELTVTPDDGVLITANRPAGLFYGVQTLLQLLPSGLPEPWIIPACRVRDYPRFAWRGVMLDVARHFHPVEVVQRFIDLAAAFKLNRFHMHLSDDQGWRLEILSWPELTRKGSSTAVDGDAGGYYTQADYAAIDAYARQRFITLVPEIDLPGHTNAVLACYPELNRTEIAPELYTGIEVGFSSLCVDKEVTYRFLTDVIGEIAAMTSGPYIHIGGDEARSTLLEDYCLFIGKVQEIVRSHGKQAIGWEEIGQAQMLPTTIAQLWNGEKYEQVVSQGGRIIFSLASKVYLDMKYSPDTTLGLFWAGYIPVRDSYDWDPTSVLPGVEEKNLLGVEAALWSETLRTAADIDTMAFPRLPGIAEIAWSPAQGRTWDEYRLRLAALAPRLRALGVNFYSAPGIPWEL